MNDTGIILTLAYPETVVMHAEEWYSPFLKYLGIGNKTHVRAGHAALVLIDKATGVLEYHDFGRYITSRPNGRVRGRDTDCELAPPMQAKLVAGELVNLKAILRYLATHPEFTHGEGPLYASVCKKIDYQKARAFIDGMQDLHFIRYAAFIKAASNCARFVTDALIASVTDSKIKKRLLRSKWFTPSTVGNVLLSNTETAVYKVSTFGEVDVFKGSVMQINRACFLDKLRGHGVSQVGTHLPKGDEHVVAHAQWLPGIAAGAWFELHPGTLENEYRFRRVSPQGHVDVDAIFIVQQHGFRYQQAYAFVHYSNCLFFHVEQHDTIYRFNRKYS
ncbi:MAG: hypothetical protein GYB39_05400 [Algicola sp.]|nr:hypothetical protein [Algicola sp.]